MYKRQTFNTAKYDNIVKWFILDLWQLLLNVYIQRLCHHSFCTSFSSRLKYALRHFETESMMENFRLETELLCIVYGVKIHTTCLCELVSLLVSMSGDKHDQGRCDNSGDFMTLVSRPAAATVCKFVQILTVFSNERGLCQRESMFTFQSALFILFMCLLYINKGLTNVWFCSMKCLSLIHI